MVFHYQDYCSVPFKFILSLGRFYTRKRSRLWQKRRHSGEKGNIEMANVSDELETDELAWVVCIQFRDKRSSHQKHQLNVNSFSCP